MITRVPSWSGLLLVALAGLLECSNDCEAFYLPGVNPQSFADGDP